MEEARVYTCGSSNSVRNRLFKKEDALFIKIDGTKVSGKAEICNVDGKNGYTGDFSFIAFKQFIHRCWRRGQTKPCKITFLINDPGDKYKVEYKIWDSLQRKKSIHDTLMSIKGE